MIDLLSYQLFTAWFLPKLGIKLIGQPTKTGCGSSLGYPYCPVGDTESRRWADACASGNACLRLARNGSKDFG
jgi:hypothetical protein